MRALLYRAELLVRTGDVDGAAETVAEAERVLTAATAGVPDDRPPDDGGPRDGVPRDGVPRDGVPRDGVPTAERAALADELAHATALVREARSP